MKQKLSRTPLIDMDACVENFGGNRFDLVIYASAKARELARKNKESAEYLNAPVSVLLELQEKKNERDKV